MRRGFGIGITILAIVLAVAIGAGAYHAGYVHGLDANGSVQIVRDVGPYGGWGFFPGLLFFPLFLFGIFFLARAAFWGGRGWRGHDHHGPSDHGPGGHGWGGRREVFEEWHRRQHEPGQSEGAGAGAEPSSA